MPSIDTLVEDIHALFEGHTFDLTNLSKFSTTIERVLATRFKEYAEGRRPYLRLSNVGQPLRKLWFQIKSGLLGEKLSPSTKLKYLYGDLCEAILIALAIEAGHEVRDQQRKVEVDDVPGSIDCIIDGVLVDVKSASTRSFVKFKEGTLFNDDPFGYVGQLKGYARALGDIEAAWLAIDKEKGHIALLKLPQEHDYDIHSKIAKAREVLDRDTPPEELCYENVSEGESGNMKLPTPCQYCDFKFHCQPNIRTFIYSKGPVFLTKVVREPKVFEARR